MEKLPICRICLVQNVRMYLVVNRNFHELYEKLTDIPFVTEDRRPILACFFCFAKLKQCYRFLRKCLKAEELFAQMINEDYVPNPLINQDHIEYLGGFIKSPIENISIVEGVQTESIAIKEELPAVCEGLDDIKPKEELQSDELELDNFDSSCLNVADIPPHNSEPDFEYEVPLMEFKIEVEEEQEVSAKQQNAREMKTSESKKLINDEKAKNSAKMNDDELILRRKKQNADRARAYRKRQKDLDAMPSTSTVQSGELVSENIVTAKLLHQKQLNAERCRRYRQKCKQLKSGANFNRGTSDSDTSTSQDTSTSRELWISVKGDC